MAVEGENLGTAAIYLTVDTTNMDAGIAKAKTKLAGMSAEAEKQYVAMNASQRKVAESLVKQAELINKTTAERVAYNAQLKIGGALGDEIARKAIANAQAINGAQADATAAAKAADAAKAEMAAADDARFKQVAADAMGEVEARNAVTAATMEQARANVALLESRTGSGASGVAQAVGALDSTVVRQQIADYAALDAVMTKGVVTTEEVAAAEAALDRLQASGMISNEQLAETFAALDGATAADTKALQSNTIANLENAGARKINSRTAYSISALLSDAATGQFSRSQREIAAIGNETGLIAKLFSPIGIAIGGTVAALALFGKEVYNREQDLLSLNKALAATGDFAGKTGIELQGVAAQVGESTGNYSDANKAVLALTKSGEVLGSQMQQMATVAVNMAYLTDQSVDNVVKELIKLQGDPTQAIAKATAAMGLLTDEQYNRIAVTQQQQGVVAAAALAMKDLGEASDAARAKLVDNAGTVIKLWTNVKNMFGELGRDIGGLGAKKSTAEQIAALQKQRDLALGEAEGGGNPHPNQDSDVVRLNAQITVLQQKLKTEAMLAAGNELANQAKQEHDKALAEALASNKQGDEGFVAQAAAINRKRYEALVGVVDPSIRDRVNATFDQQIRDAVKRANSQFGRASTSSGHATKDNSDKLRQMALDDFNKEVEAAGKVADAEARSVAETKAFTDNLNAQLQTRTQLLDLQVRGVGMGDKEVQQEQELLAIQQQYEQKQAQLDSQHANHSRGMSDEQYQEESAALKAHYDADTALTKRHYAEMDDAQSSWINGAIAAMQNWADAGMNVADQTKTLFTNAFSGMNDALVNFAQTGKLSFSGLANSIIADLARIELKAAESKVLGLLTTAISGWLGGGTAIDTGAIAGGNFTGPHAMGGVFEGPITPFSSGGIVDSPRLFAFANGTGLMGEAGPEAVMPLSQGRDGKLGVQVHGGGGNVIVNVENHTDSKAQVSRSKDSSGNDMITVMINATANEVDRRIATGGSTAKVIQQRFGLSRAGIPT